MNPQTWYEITTCIKGKVILIDSTESLEKAENIQEDLKKKGIEAKVFKWRLENENKQLVGEL